MRRRRSPSPSAGRWRSSEGATASPGAGPASKHPEQSAGRLSPAPVVPCLAVTFEEELTLALWTSEAARSTVLGFRGHTDASVRVAGRARILATRCSELGVALRPDF